MSTLLNRAVEEFAKLPSIGERSALRLVLHLLSRSEEDVEAFSEAIINFRHNIKYCVQCNNLSDGDLCPICSDSTRDRSVVCVVEGVRELMSIEQTGHYKGLYFVLGGVISPMRGISPSSLKIDTLINTITALGVSEVILALNSSIEGETTNFYITRKLSPFDVTISNLSRGIGFEDNLEHADELTLLHAINNRITVK